MDFDRLKKIIKKYGFTVKEVLKNADIREATFYNCQKKKSIETKYLEKIAKTLHVPVSYFFDENANGVNGNSIVGNNNKQGIIISQNNEIEKLQSELDSCKELNEELRQRIIDKDELIELLKNK